MGFFVDNWLWFLVGAIVILMTLIGYIAEKTDFGRKDIQKSEKPKKEKKQPKAKKELKEVLESEPMPEVQMSLATNSILEEPIETFEPMEELTNVNEEVEAMQNLNVPFGDVTFEAPSVEETLEPVENLNNSFEEFTYAEPTVSVEEPIEAFQPMEELTNANEEVEAMQNLNVPFGDVTFEAPSVEETLEPVENLNNSFEEFTYAEPTVSVEDVVASESAEELNLEDLNTPNIELPDLDSIVTEEDDTDDVWKF